MVRIGELEAMIAAIEKRRLAIEGKRTMFQFETAFFIPLLALLFLVTYFSKSNEVKMTLYIFTIVLIVADLIYSIIVYRDLTAKQKKLEEVIRRKIGNID